MAILLTRHTRRGITLFAALLLLLSIAPPGGLYQARASVQTPSSPAPTIPGELVRAEPIPDIGDHPAWRILYTSTGLDGSLTPITGVIAVPDKPTPAVGFPLLAVAHPTAGLGRQCAPSLLLQSNNSVMADLYQETLSPFLDEGFAIVMSDYQGLGAAGDPSYLIGQVEGANVLDSIRAAHQFPDAALAAEALLIGHSQGGHAAAFALQLAPDYAPELVIDGAVLAAPALDPAGIFAGLTEDDIPSDTTSLILMVMSAWSSTYPDASLDQVTTPAGQELIESSIAKTCLFEAGQAAAGHVPSDLFLPGASTAWADHSAQNTPAPGPWPVPVLIVHGTEDEVIDPALSLRFVEGLCASGTTVAYLEYPDTDHFGVLSAARDDILSWLSDRANRLTAPNNCPP